MGSDRYIVREGEDYSSEIINTVTGHRVGSDGGEPEDQSLCRNWSWVAPALNVAYEEGSRSRDDDVERDKSVIDTAIKTADVSRRLNDITVSALRERAEHAEAESKRTREAAEELLYHIEKKSGCLLCGGVYTVLDGVPQTHYAGTVCAALVSGIAATTFKDTEND